MGVTVRAYSEAYPIRAKHLSEEDESLWETHVKVFPGHFPFSFRGLESGVWYETEGIPEYDILSTAYGSYGAFRRSLAEFRNLRVEDLWDDTTNSDPFAAIINFSDAEGFIGNIAIKELRNAFIAHRDDYLAWTASLESAYTQVDYNQTYDSFITGLEFAKDGFISFI